MATPKRYTIDKITDIFQIPPERFDAFLVDFKSYYELGQPFADLIKEVAKTGGINVDVIPMEMTWIDDNEHNATIILKTQEDNDVAKQ